MTAPQEKPRLYYDCPLKAAWMAKYFGMRFRNLEHEVYVLPLIDGERKGRWYIWGDSLHLLEPQDLDILYRTNGYCQTVGVHIGFPKAKAQLEAGACIIQRNGLAFMWPESEAA